MMAARTLNLDEQNSETYFGMAEEKVPIYVRTLGLPNRLTKIAQRSPRPRPKLSGFRRTYFQDSVVPCSSIRFL